MVLTPRAAVAASMFLFSFGLVLFELLLTRLFAVVLFSSFAHLALALALLGISVGALAQHFWPTLVPERGLEERLGWLSIGMSVTTVLAVLFTVVVPVTVQGESAPADYGERSMLSWHLLDSRWFTLLMPVLALPFALTGAAFAGAFQRRKESIGLLYGADLIGGASAAVIFVPLLCLMPGPDVAFIVAAVGGLSAALLFHAVGRRAQAGVGVATAALGLLLAGWGALGDGLIGIRYAAGYSEDQVTYVRWTPLTRLAVHEGERGHFMLLDNSSASEIVRSEGRRAQLAQEPNRGLVYQLHEAAPEGKPPAQVAILAASAGPEVAVAQSFGFRNIESIDIAPEIGDVVAERYPDNPVNPFLHGDTRRIVLDGRAAILHSDHDYDIIQMVHANLHSSAGQLANAWSPALLESKEAFELYFSKLTDDGTLSFGRGSRTKSILRAAVAAMREMGVEDPQRNVVWVAGPASVFLAKKRPFTEEEVARIKAIISTRQGQYVHFDPTAPTSRVWDDMMKAPLVTDDRPYLESPAQAADGLSDALVHLLAGGDEQVEPVTVIYHALMLQTLFVMGAGLLCLLVPALRRQPLGLERMAGTGVALGYVSCLGYGYLSVETVLLHDLVLFVGHPVYAISVVILAMLLFSGLGSIWVGRLPREGLERVLLGVLAGIVVLGAVQAYLVPPVLYAVAHGLPIGVRMGLVLVALAPLGFIMGMPFPLCLRLLRPEAASLVPWMWALNGWMSVVASIGTVVVSRLVGYDAAFAVALLAYVLAGAFALGLPRVGAAVRS
jgi:hypothetical protein